MKKVFIATFLFIYNSRVCAQYKSDLDFLLPYEKKSIVKSTKFGDANCSGFIICYRVLRYVDIEGKTRFCVEFKNESKLKLSFKYCISENENSYKNISNWRQRIYLNPEEKKHTGIYVSHLTNSIWVSVGAVLKGTNTKTYEYEGVNSNENNTTICAYCAINNSDVKCPKGEIDESVNQDLLMEGYEYTETELGKIKGTIGLTEDEKKNQKIDAVASIASSLGSLISEIKKNKKEKKERLRVEHEALISKQEEEKNINGNINQKIYDPKQIGTTQYDYGKIPQKVPATHLFVLNKKVQTALATCGCTTPVVDGNKVSVTYNANSKGIFSKGINITYEDGQTEVLRITGEVE